MKFKALFFVALMVVFVSGLSAAAPQAVLQSLKGKVEVKAPGTKTWVPATEGQVLSPATTLSTGFDSSVVVVIDKTTIQVKPLTRMTIDKLVEESGTVKTSTFLRVGSVTAEVKSAEGVKQDFKVQSPYSTASVRGTKFDYDGLRLKVKEGLVALILGRSKRDTQPAPEAAEATEASAEETPAPEAGAAPEGAAEGESTEAESTEEAATEGESPEGDSAEGETTDGEAPEADGPDAGVPEAEAPAETPPAQDEDFVGSPDIQADANEAVPVPAGQDVKVKVDFKNPTEAPRSSGSADKENLSKGAGTGEAPPPAAPVKVATKGGVTLRIEFKKP